MKSLFLISFIVCIPFYFYGSELNPQIDFPSPQLGYFYNTSRIPPASKRHIICITIPKSGTHLLYKCLELINLKDVDFPERKPISPQFVEMARRINRYPPPNHYKGNFHVPTVGPIPKGTFVRMKNNIQPTAFTIHWPYTKESEDIFNNYCKHHFFMIRDPRDQLVSMVFMVYKNINGEEVPFEEALLDLIDGGQRCYIRWAVEIQSTHPLMWEYGVVGFYHLYLPWMQSEKFYTVKFENLIGPAGDGSVEDQIKEIQNIGHHLSIELTQEKVQEIQDNLFGGTLTFREGKIGSWKRYFTPKVKEVFKSTPGACQLLIDLGYETDNDW